MRRRTLLWAVAMVLCFVLSPVAMLGCDSKDAAEAAAQNKDAVAAAEAWLKLVDGESYDQSWDEAAAYFRDAVPKEQWPQQVGAARKPLGAVKSRKLKSAKAMDQLPGAPDGKYVVIQYDTVFENKASAVETITPMLDKDGAWRVSGYFIK